MAAPLDPTFFLECRRLLGETAYLSGEFPTARAAFSWLAEHADREADRLRAQDWLERIDWRTARAEPAGFAGSGASREGLGTLPGGPLQPTPILQPPGPADGTTSPHDRTQVPPR